MQVLSVSRGARNGTGGTWRHPGSSNDPLGKRSSGDQSSTTYAYLTPPPDPGEFSSPHAQSSQLALSHVIALDDGTILEPADHKESLLFFEVIYPGMVPRRFQKPLRPKE